MAFRHGNESEMKDQFRHVVLVSVGIGPVLRHDVGLEAESLEGFDGIGFEVGDEHAVEMAQPALAPNSDEVADQRSAEADTAPGGIDHPLYAADQAQGAALAPMEGGVGDDPRTIQREHREY